MAGCFLSEGRAEGPLALDFVRRAMKQNMALPTQEPQSHPPTPAPVPMAVPSPSHRPLAFPGGGLMGGSWAQGWEPAPAEAAHAPSLEA